MAELSVSRDRAISVAAELVKHAHNLDTAIVAAVSLLSSFGDENARLRRQRDELLAACIGALAFMDELEVELFDGVDELPNQLRAAIALCEKGDPADAT